MIANSSHKSGGCGCGGGTTLSVAPCSCGGGGCASCQGQGIVRPTFFAGQLLTEDDLQLLTDYAVQKNRLHNRNLFGDGVVCGLEVSCHPCGDGQVIVHPGYALDCCGNDLTLACAQTLDINAMIRDLRRDQLGGYDCVDPCPDPPGSEADCSDQTFAVRADGSNKLSAAASTMQSKTPFRTYCLYIRYCEQPSDPVMPYSTGDDCGRLACEPTRVREGVKFELRCKPTRDAANALIQRLCGCLGDLQKLRVIITLVNQLRDQTEVVSTVLSPPPRPLSVPEFSTILQTESFMNTLDGVATTAAKSDQASFSVQPATTLSDVREVATVMKAFDSFTEAQQAGLLKNGAVLERVNKARAVLAQTVAVVAQGSRTHFTDVRDWLIERLNHAAFLSDCTLRQRVFAMAMPVVGEQERSSSTATLLISTNKPLIEAFFSYVRDCICRALNPPCEPCDDTGVLLACLEVEDCNITRICNLERTFVLSPAAVRYWLPPLQLIGNVAERLCCAPFESLLTLNAERRTREFDFDQLLKSEIERIVKDSLCSFTGTVDTLGDLLNQIWQLFHPPSTPAGGTASPTDIATEQVLPGAETATTSVPGGVEKTTKAVSGSLLVNAAGVEKAKTRFAPRKKRPAKTKPATPATVEAGGEEVKSEQPK